MMDEEKKKELAEYDARWEFEKQVQIPNISGGFDWEKVKNLYNNLQEEQGDLYMAVDKLPNPDRLESVKIWWLNRKTEGTTVTFHHSGVYRFYLKLANELEVSVGQAVFKLLSDKEALRKHFGLGGTVNVNFSEVGDMDTSSSKVSKEELKEMIDGGED